MGKKDVLTRILAIIGTVLVWLPLLAPVIFSLVTLFQRGRFLFDYLMPAELFPVELLGGALLLWAALRACAYKKLIGWSLAAAIIFLVGSMGLAQITGLASGKTEATGWLMTVVLIPLVMFLLTLVITGLGGVLLVKDLSKPVIVKKEDSQVHQN